MNRRGDPSSSAKSPVCGAGRMSASGIRLPVCSAYPLKLEESLSLCWGASPTLVVGGCVPLGEPFALRVAAGLERGDYARSRGGCDSGTSLPSSDPTGASLPMRLTVVGEIAANLAGPLVECPPSAAPELRAASPCQSTLRRPRRFVALGAFWPPLLSRAGGSEFPERDGSKFPEPTAADRPLSTAEHVGIDMLRK